MEASTPVSLAISWRIRTGRASAYRGLHVPAERQAGGRGSAAAAHSGASVWKPLCQALTPNFYVGLKKNSNIF